MKMRLDQALVERGLIDSREKAKRSIMAGIVKLNGHPARKASDTVRPGDEVTVTEHDKYVSRGGLKLEKAIAEFAPTIEGITAIDLGASTGGFTDCLLQAGAAKVYAVDVGQGQLAWKLRSNPRVVVMEKTNARTLTSRHFPDNFVPVDIIVADCSFISLRKILPAAIPLVRPQGRFITLIKPQFEAGKEEADRGHGVISDPEVHQRVIAELQEFVKSSGALSWLGVTESPIKGPAGNTEFLAFLERI